MAMPMPNMVLRLIRGVWLLILEAVWEGLFGLKTMILLGVLARTGLAFDFGGDEKIRWIC